MKFNHSSIKSFGELINYIRPWRSKAGFAAICSTLNKIFDIAPEVLIGVAVDLVVEKKIVLLHHWDLNPLAVRCYFLG